MSIDRKRFSQLLSRNLLLPIGVGVVSSIFFVAIVFYLLSVSRWIETVDVMIGKAHQTLRLTVDLETGLRGYLITGEPEFLSPYEQGRTRIKPEIDALKALVSNDPVREAQLDRIYGAYRQWNDYASEMIRLRSADAAAADVNSRVRAGVGKGLMDDIRGDFSRFIASSEQLKLDRNTVAQRNAVVLVMAFLAFVLSLSVLLAYRGRRDLLHLSTTYDTVLNQQLKNADALAEQAWLRAGQTDLGDRIIGRLPLPVLCRNVLAFLADYLDVRVGAAYVLQNGNTLSRVASYAFSAEAEQREQSFEIGESLLGQAAAERRIVQVDAVPGDYFKINSGLGASDPAYVMIVPVSADDQLNAVFELGFLHAPDARVAQFLELIAANVGAAIEAANYRRRLQDVLNETQQLNEELQTQQEELRAANEELADQSQALRESQARLESQQSELEQTNEQLEEQTQTLARQRDVLGEKNTALKDVQLLLEERALDLARASRYKSEFLANMSHELRTPLNSALILSKLLADNTDGNLSPEQVRFAESIYASGNDLLDLINDILDISKVEAGKLEIQPADIAIDKLRAALQTAFAPLAAEKHLEFGVNVTADVPATLYSDRKRLEQILRNLLSNAIKFTDSGSVQLTVSRYGDDAVAFAVVDSGIGIPGEHQEVIFDAFRQLDGTTNRRFGGTGLGLSISRDLARLLGGGISVASTPGQGSTFTLILPLQYLEADAAALPVLPQPPAAAPHAVAPAPAPAPQTPPLPFSDDRDRLSAEEKTILVIEDEPRFAQILYDLAHQLKYNCLVATAADVGFGMALSHLPDAILLDMRLPDHSGMTVLERLKDNSTTRHIPVHVISVEDRRETALHMGAVGYMVKPASREELTSAFFRLEAKLSQKMKHVLLVEDDALHRDGIARLIGDDDIEITSVERGEQALQQLKEQVYDCMIIDLTLPDMEGSELLRRMTEEEIYSFPPVIVYTARNLTRDEEAMLLKYSRSIIIKGARSPERLLDEVTLFLHKVEADMPPERQKMLKVARRRDRIFEGRKILVVDDDVRNIFALTSALEHKGATVEIGRNGRDAIDKLQQDTDIDLVLMDIMMPEMDGYEAMQEIRKDPRFAQLPIIAVTAKAMRDDQEHCLRAGANDYLAKPVDLDRLLSLIRVWMPKLQRA